MQKEKQIKGIFVNPSLNSRHLSFELFIYENIQLKYFHIFSKLMSADYDVL